MSPLLLLSPTSLISPGKPGLTSTKKKNATGGLQGAASVPHHGRRGHHHRPQGRAKAFRLREAQEPGRGRHVLVRGGAVHQAEGGKKETRGGDRSGGGRWWEQQIDPRIGGIIVCEQNCVVHGSGGGAHLIYNSGRPAKKGRWRPRGFKNGVNDFVWSGWCCVVW